jgi:predicted nucleic acid-binding protein
MILVDTSAWIAFFRDAQGAAEVDALLDSGEAAVCGPVLTELMRGITRPKERREVGELIRACHWIGQPSELWEQAGELGSSLKRRGHNVKTLDLLIAIHAISHDVPLLSADADFALIARLSSGLRLV